MKHDTEYRDEPADDLNILYPHRKVTIAGRDLVVREYGFEEGIELAPHIQPLVEGLVDSVGLGTMLSMGALRQAFAGNKEHVFALLAASCNQPVEWVRSLNDKDGDNLLLVWYSVNSDFFVRRVVSDLVVKRKVAKEVAGLMSTPPSRAGATTRKGSASTPAVN